MAPQLAADLARTSPDNPGEYGDVNVTAKILDVSPSFLNKARLSGSGPPYAKFGHAVRYHIPTVHKWAASRVRHSTSDRSGAA